MPRRHPQPGRSRHPNRRHRLAPAHQPRPRSPRQRLGRRAVTGRRELSKRRDSSAQKPPAQPALTLEHRLFGRTYPRRPDTNLEPQPPKRQAALFNSVLAPRTVPAIRRSPRRRGRLFVAKAIRHLRLQSLPMTAPDVASRSAVRDTDRQFALGMAVITAIALIVRVVAAFSTHGKKEVISDPTFYSLQAVQLTHGHWFRDPFILAIQHRSVPSATHPPCSAQCWPSPHSSASTRPLGIGW